MYSQDFFILMLTWVAIALPVFVLVYRSLNRRAGSSPTTSTGGASRPQQLSASQMAEDIRATKTSQVEDAISILDDLGATNSGYRHYCELVGTSMASGGVTAPYSRRQVAYYDIKCYRIDGVYGGGQRETLVAHEHSIDPFFFTDASCDTPVYVDLASFGENVILVNSTNHIEGPSSDFAQAFKKSASSTGTAGTAYAMVASALARGANTLLGAARRLRLPRGLAPLPSLQPACALAGGTMPAPDGATRARPRLMFASGGRSHGGHSGRSSQGGRGGQPPRQVTINLGHGPYHMPGHLGDFMGGSGPWVMGGGYAPRRTSSSSADVILGMGLGALLNSMASTQQQAHSATGGTDGFRGYRLVENVVPLGSPVYCIGEIYRNGTDVYMGRSLAKDYPTSYFATKPESEVLSAIGSK